jgi:hypothetical protein
MGLHTSSQFRPPDGNRFRSLEQSGAELKGRNMQKIAETGGPVRANWVGLVGGLCGSASIAFTPIGGLPLRGRLMSEPLAGN